MQPAVTGLGPKLRPSIERGAGDSGHFQPMALAKVPMLGEDSSESSSGQPKASDPATMQALH